MIKKNNLDTVEVLRDKVLQLTSDNEALREELDERSKNSASKVAYDSLLEMYREENMKYLKARDKISSLEATLDREREELSDTIAESIPNEVYAKQLTKCKRLAAQHREVDTKLLISESDNKELRETIQTYEKELEFLKQKEAVQDSMAVNAFTEAFNDDIVLYDSSNK